MLYHDEHDLLWEPAFSHVARAGLFVPAFRGAAFRWEPLYGTRRSVEDVQGRLECRRLVRPAYNRQGDTLYIIDVDFCYTTPDDRLALALGTLRIFARNPTLRP